MFRDFYAYEHFTYPYFGYATYMSPYISNKTVNVQVMLIIIWIICFKKNVIRGWAQNFVIALLIKLFVQHEAIVLVSIRNNFFSSTQHTLKTFRCNSKNYKIVVESRNDFKQNFVIYTLVSDMKRPTTKIAFLSLCTRSNSSKRNYFLLVVHRIFFFHVPLFIVITTAKE